MPADSLQALALDVHRIRPDWSTQGIRAVLLRDPRPLEVLRPVALAAAADPTARTPGVIPDRDAHGAPARSPVAPMTHLPIPEPDVAQRGAAMARAALEAAADRRLPGEITSTDVRRLAQQLQQQRPDWSELLELQTVLTRLVRSHGITELSELVARTLELAGTAKTPWGLLAAATPPAAVAPHQQAPGPANDHPAEAAQASADQPADEPW